MDDGPEECTAAARNRPPLPSRQRWIVEYRAGASPGRRMRGIAGRLRQALADLTGLVPRRSRPWPIIEVTLAPADADVLERADPENPGPITPADKGFDCVDSLMATAIAHAAARRTRLKAALDIAPRGPEGTA